jgi:hypothetical protein
MMTNGRGVRCQREPQQQPCCRAHWTGGPWRSQTLGVLAIVDRWRARQGGAVRAGLVAPAVRARPALADCAFAFTLETQRRHPLADHRKIVGGAGCVRFQLGRHAPVMPEDGCSIVKPKTVATAGQNQPRAGPRGMSTPKYPTAFR